MEDKKTAILIENLDKVYKLYDKPVDRIKEAFGLKNIYQGVILDGLLSRKKQIVPNIMEVLERL